MIADRAICDALEGAVRSAGDAILDVRQRGINTVTKGDGSPVTEADQRAEDIVLEALSRLVPDIPVVSEEKTASHTLKPGGAFFLVDPLDGTREFIRPDTKGAFTVNIGLIEDGAPTLGVLFAPARGRYFFGVVGQGAWEDGRTIHTRPLPTSGAVAYASRSHQDPRTDALLEASHVGRTRLLGSSLKFALLACGEADLYARHSPTMEWDTAAGDAILRAAGGTVCHEDGTLFRYGKPSYRNGPFIARGRPAL